MYGFSCHVVTAKPISISQSLLLVLYTSSHKCNKLPISSVVEACGDGLMTVKYIPIWNKYTNHVTAVIKMSIDN